MNQYLLSLSDINYHIGNKPILKLDQLHIKNQEIVTIVGPNGAGKSTLLSIAIGLLKPNSGKIKRYDINGQKLHIGYVPQFINRDSTLPLSVDEFLKLSKSKTTAQLITTLLGDLKITHLQHNFLSHLSGGELRKVLFARALLNRPHLLVLDEPTAGVDRKGQEDFYHRLHQLRERYQFSILLVSHDLQLVMSATDRVICLNKEICCQGTPHEILSNPNYQSLFNHQETIKVN